MTSSNTESPPPADFPYTYARRTLLASLVIIHMGFTVLFPLLSPLGREMGLSEFQITSIIATSSITVFLITPMWGRISDRWGRKRVLLIGLFGFSFGTVLFNSVLYAGLAGVLSGMTLYLVLIAARVTHAGAMSASMPAASAYMADITDTSNRTKGMGAVGAATNVGAILGPALAGLAVFTMLTPLWTIAAIACINGLLMLWLLPEPPSHQRPKAGGRKLKFTDPRILPFVIVGVTMFMGNALVQQTMGFRFQDAVGLTARETASVFGTAMMLSAGCALIAQFFIVQRLNLAPFTLLRLAIPALIIAFTIMAVFESRWVLTGAMMIQGLGMGLAGPGFMAGASLAVSAEEQGAVAGVSGACPPLGFTIGPLLGGALYQISPVLPYATAAVIYVILLAFMQRIHHRIREQSND